MSADLQANLAELNRLIARCPAKVLHGGGVNQVAQWKKAWDEAYRLTKLAGPGPIKVKRALVALRGFE